MSETTNPVTPAPAPENQFQQQAELQSVGIVREFIDFLRYNKAWWLVPIVVVSLVVGGALYLASSPAAPFIYSIF